MFYLLFAMSFLRKKGKSKKQELTLREKSKEISGKKGENLQWVKQEHQIISICTLRKRSINLLLLLLLSLLKRQTNEQMNKAPKRWMTRGRINWGQIFEWVLSKIANINLLCWSQSLRGIQFQRELRNCTPTPPLIQQQPTERNR